MTAADGIQKLERELTLLRRVPVVLFGVGVTALVLVWFAYCRPTPTPLPPKEAKTSDSLAATKPDFTHRVDTLTHYETTYVAISRHERASATIAARAADSLHRTAIAAESAAVVERDTSSAWRRAAQAWHTAADSLGVVATQLASAYSAESTARVAADARAGEYQRRAAALEDLNGRLATDLRHAEAPCYAIPHLVRCPSRKTVAVLSLATGYLVSREDVRHAVGRTIKGAVTLISP